MKKFLPLLIVALTTLFIACGDDDDDNEVGEGGGSNTNTSNTFTCSDVWAGCTAADFTANDYTTDTTQIAIDLVAFQPYSPKCLTVKVGQTVIIGASSIHPFESKCGQDTVMDSQDGNTSEVTFTFAAPGYYNYRCGVHATMMGNILVVP